MVDSGADSESDRVRMINNHGTIEEQLPRPPDGQVKALSSEFRDFVSSHPEVELTEHDFSFFGQIETAYFASKDAVVLFDQPQAVCADESDECDVIVHYTTDVA